MSNKNLHKKRNQQVKIEKDSKEQEWFDFEIKVRKIVSELIDPIIKRELEDKEAIKYLKKFIEVQKRKTEEVDFIILKCMKKITAFDEVNRKLIDMDSDRKLLETRTSQETNSIKSEIESIR